jgi:hypothetical protein
MIENAPWPPDALLHDDMCGPLAAWFLLRRFGYRPQARRLLRLCGWQRAVSTHVIGLAVALAEYGLSVEFHSEPDPAPEASEIQQYKRAEGLGITTRAPLATAQLITRAQEGQPSIVLFRHFDEAHLSALVGGDTTCVHLHDDALPLGPFDQARAAEGCFRLAVLVQSRAHAV